MPKIFVSDRQTDHQPRQYMVAGRIVDPLENPNRLETLARSLERVGLERIEPEDFGRAPILRIHDAAYVEFLETIWSRWRELPSAGPEVLPNIHPYRGAGDMFRRGEAGKPTGVIGTVGWYVGDLSCAIMEGTWRAVYASAQSAIAGARTLLDGEPSAISLCRPPGHHAYADRCSGFCFLNNAAIAAEELRRKFDKVAILDFDTHHGDGTQAIFYERDDVFYGSVHTDPTSYYPHFAGYADERGTGANLNLPLAQGSDDGDFIAANRRLAEAAVEHGAQALVLSAGWDAHQDDPLSRLKVTDAAYPQIARIYAELGLPTLVVQEGGYSLDVNTRVAPAFVRTFLDEHRVG